MGLTIEHTGDVCTVPDALLSWLAGRAWSLDTWRNHIAPAVDLLDGQVKVWINPDRADRREFEDMKHYAVHVCPLTVDDEGNSWVGEIDVIGETDDPDELVELVEKALRSLSEAVERPNCPGCGLAIHLGRGECGGEGEGLCSQAAYALDTSEGREPDWDASWGAPPDADKQAAILTVWRNLNHQEP